MTEDWEKVPGTWAHELKEHFDAFSNFCWEGFNRAVKDMSERGHENKIDFYLWRDYVLWDMQRRHDEEVKK